jgi:dipeptidyl aminopeptidase/acylaminoacyl peptidase
MMLSFELPRLIPCEDLFGNPEKASPNISPDGAHLAYLAPDEGVLNVWVRSVGQADDRAVTRDRKRGIRSYLWAYDGAHILYLQDRDGDENWHVYASNLDTGEIRDLTPHENVQAQLVAVDHRFPNEILVGLNLRDATVHDVHRVNLASGETTLEAENPGNIVGWIADSRFQVRAAHAALPDGGFQLLAREAVTRPSIMGEKDGPVFTEWKPLVTWGPDEEGNPYGFTPDDGALYVGSSLGSDTQELRMVEVATGLETTLASNPTVDLGEVLSHPTKDHIQAVGFNEDRLVWEVLDPDVADDMRALKLFRDGDAHVVSRSLDDRTWIVLYVLDNAPASYYTYNRDTGGIEFLFTTRPVLEKQTLARMQPVHVTTRDGLTLHCYLTVPPGVEAKNLPLVLDVHGGPWARDHWGFNPEAQWLANRGYACMQVNFRGSTGFGKRFLHAGDRQWGAKMHDDLLDAVDWAVQEGIADPERVAIYGGSYGGYAALVGAAFTPEVFACAVDIVGPSSIRTLIASIPPYWEPLKKLFYVRVGDPDTEPEFLDSISPLFKADQIRRPLLIAQGANDPRVKQAESEQIVKAMRDRGQEVEYLLFEDEGHGFARPENRLRFYGYAEKFLAKHLGGRAED